MSKAELDEHLRCKAYGHAWEPTSPVGFFKEHPDKALFSACTRCGSTKVDDLDLYGHPERTYYYHSESYRAFLDRDKYDRPGARNLVYSRQKRRKQ